MKILKPFSTKDQSGKTKSKTHPQIKFCLTVCYYNLVQSSFTEKFRSLHKCMCPTFDMRHNLWFRYLSWNITSSLIDFICLRRNISGVTAEQMDGQIQYSICCSMRYIYIYIYSSQISLIFQRRVPYFHKTDDSKCVFPRI